MRKQEDDPINISVHHNNRLLWQNLCVCYDNSLAYFSLIVNQRGESFRQPLVYIRIIYFTKLKKNAHAFFFNRDI